MFITMLNSGANFGRIKALDIYLTGIWGWNISAIIGLSLQAVILVFIPKMYSYIQKGSVDLGELNEPSNGPGSDIPEEKKSTPMLEMNVNIAPYYKYEDEAEG